MKAASENILNEQLSAMEWEKHGIFYLRGLLEKLEAEEGHHNLVRQTVNKVFENTVGQRSSDERPTVHTLDKCADKEENKSLTSNCNLPFLVSLSDLPPMEAAFSIEKISKTIFSMLEQSDLLKCRLVSSSWLRMATNEKLLKPNKGAIRIALISQPKSEYDTIVTFKKNNKSLKDVTDLLNYNGSRLCIFSAKVSLKMTTDQIDFVDFLDRCGFNVNSLKIEFDNFKNHSRFVYEIEYLLEFVTKLLTEQLPNLETLNMRFDKSAQFAGVIDPQQLVNIKQGSYFATEQNHSLRTLILRGPVPYEIVEVVCSLAPNLNKLDFDDLGFVVKHKRWAHLIKKLDFRPSAASCNQVDAFEAVVRDQKKLNTKSFIVDFQDICDKLNPCPRSAALLTEVFEKSCHSLERLTLRKVFFSTAPCLPCMPKVKKIRFCRSFNASPEWSWLPRGTSIVTTFPTLSTIIFYNVAYISSVTDFLSLCKYEVVESVKKIKCVGFRMDAIILQSRFPNARIYLSD